MLVVVLLVVVLVTQGVQRAGTWVPALGAGVTVLGALDGLVTR